MVDKWYPGIGKIKKTICIALCFCEHKITVRTGENQLNTLSHATDISIRSLTNV